MGHVLFVPDVAASLEPAHFPSRVEAVPTKQFQEDRDLKTSNHMT
jgi:hypothetical protein